MFSPILPLIQSTYVLTLLQILLGPDNHLGCLAEPLTDSNHHHHHHHHHHGHKHHSHHNHHNHLYSRDDTEHHNPHLLQSSLKFYDPSADHQNHLGKGDNYQLVFQSIGKTFFDEWDFFSEHDPTHGMVEYQASEPAWTKGLVILQPSSMDSNFTSAIMKVDNYTYLADGQNRNSIRLTSKKSFKYGLVILDVMKMPFGCSAWPAFWTVGENWPHGGEIDIVEGVNMGTVNQMTLHSSPGCKVKDKMSKSASGKVLHTDCDATGSGNVGCGVADPSSASLGKAFNDNGGGVFVMEWTESGITVWRFNRTEIPSDLAKGENPQPSKWTIPPVSHWDQEDCNSLSQGFSEHKIVFDITVCGDWAGAADVFNVNGLCSGSCSSVVKDPSVFKDAYWEVASVKLYQ
ncbi:uncharacterized protein PGTG_16250 [Puccinia graminis f. sp. tritici CRL 75-36-700-3]|uniref:GH16 domain-containing protein n=1 Tax=Puccinia graminis f. sp. tritici (strain CRL 75-36-700-3 / race SCCL) TaxID=418459 RepID=E3L075_PUCGT|nr:uncharacterized protein PGTG_16250 [Puccinia graminis f. sp. tritici CRL 75-36-700-3]EFP89962.2 hypothetical protein PGTG_16250 [Puccinia graminis f. sp. tritici CRL 75-36-700-3]